MAEVEKKLGREEWLDILKCIVMYLVVIGHASNSNSPEEYRYYIYSFHMPFFFMISGMSYYFQTRRREYGFLEMMQNKARTLIWPYLTLNALAIPIWLLNYRILSYRDESIPELIGAVFYSNQKMFSSATNATWFILTLFLVIMSFFIFNMWAKGNEHHLTLVILVIASFGYTMTFRQEKFATPWHLDTVSIALMLFLLGFLFVKHLDFFKGILGSKRRQLLWAVVLFPIAFCCAKYNVKITMASNHYGSFLLFMGAVIGFGGICLIISMNLPSLRLLNFIGRNTITYLALHAPCFRFMVVYSETTKAFKSEHPILLGTIVFFALIPVVWVIERFFPWIIGRKKKR